MLSCEKRLSNARSADPAPAAGGAGVVPNPPLARPKLLPLPAAAGASAPKPLPNPPPVFNVEENPEAVPNPEVAAGLSVVGAAKEKEEAERAEEAAVEEPNPEGGCVGAAKALPKPVEDGAVEEPNPPLGAAKLKVLAWAGAGAPKPIWSEIFRINTGAMASMDLII